MIYYFLKRLIDIIFSLLGLIIASPIMLLTAVFIKLDSAGPVMADIPQRVGKDGGHFKMFKFRSMVINAHEILQHNPQLLKEYKQNSYKIHHDPRITRIGRFIRRYSIDELPQLLNILSGDMSLVGPRAYYPFELEEQQQKYPGSKKYVKIILGSKPGLTGVWQISGRSEINFEKRVQMDAEYVLKRSIVYDLLIVLRTIPAVISGRGAI